ncbi:MAG: helix-turn-helix domain-containing protein [Pseudomonadota bacterium]
MFGTELKRWRLAKRLSQEGLGEIADVSPRHVSCLERGVAWPSEQMVLRLARALDLPLRERNSLLGCAGYVQRWSDAGDQIPEKLVPVVDRMLSGQRAPAYVLNGVYTVLRANDLGWQLLGLMDPLAKEGMNVAEGFFSDGPHRELIENYRAVAQSFLARIRSEASNQGSASILWPIVERAEKDPAIHDGNEPVLLVGEPVIPVTINGFGTRTSWMTVLMTFGSPQDAMVEQLTVEQFLPADDHTAAFVEALYLSSPATTSTRDDRKVTVP